MLLDLFRQMGDPPSLKASEAITEFLIRDVLLHRDADEVHLVGCQCRGNLVAGESQQELDCSLLECHCDSSKWRTGLASDRSCTNPDHLSQADCPCNGIATKPLTCVREIGRIGLWEVVWLQTR